MTPVRIGAIVLRVDDLDRQLRFWSAALDYAPREAPSEDWAVLAPRSGVGPNLSLDKRHSVAQVPPRTHLDLYTHDQEREVTRLLGLGAKRIDWPRPPAADFVTLEDPEGNRFDVVQLR
ncbi:VOC family protein [Mycobacteroides immunogenum]|uniref:VOC family protein n=1 Tax=Mycobacteroides immunogenum TaxID=83262 RepID=UPI0025B7955C|nr:VOC family protein [Mycobacteroides immunogenum]WJR35861.1 VOC family protein [Mycobacteroides immunogenum]